MSDPLFTEFIFKSPEWAALSGPPFPYIERKKNVIYSKILDIL